MTRADRSKIRCGQNIFTHVRSPFLLCSMEKGCHGHYMGLVFLILLIEFTSTRSQSNFTVMNKQMRNNNQKFITHLLSQKVLIDRILPHLPLFFRQLSDTASPLFPP